MTDCNRVEAGCVLLLPDSFSEPPLGPPVRVWVCHSQQRQQQYHSCPHLGKVDTQNYVVISVGQFSTMLRHIMIGFLSTCCLCTGLIYIIKFILYEKGFFW